MHDDDDDNDYHNDGGDDDDDDDDNENDNDNDEDDDDDDDKQCHSQPFLSPSYRCNVAPRVGWLRSIPAARELCQTFTGNSYNSTIVDMVLRERRKYERFSSKPPSHNSVAIFITSRNSCTEPAMRAHSVWSRPRRPWE